MGVFGVLLSALVAGIIWKLWQKTAALENRINSLESDFESRQFVSTGAATTHAENALRGDEATDEAVPYTKDAQNAEIAAIAKESDRSAIVRASRSQGAAEPAPVQTETASAFNVDDNFDDNGGMHEETIDHSGRSDHGQSEYNATPGEPSRFSLNFEDLFGRRLPIWAGGITLAVAGFLIVRYAIDIGLFGKIFTPSVQVACGFLFGGSLIAAAELAFRNSDRVDDPRVSQALSGAGIATLYAAFLVASNVYYLIGPVTAFAGLAFVTAGAMWLSTRHGLPTALLGLAGGLAAPAMIAGVSANVPLLAVYLALTIAGLAGISRMQRWPLLGLAALIGGAGWSLWIILVSQSLDLLGSLSIGGFVILLAIGLPMMSLDGPRSVLMRSAAAFVGAVQLALLVAIGGFEPLHWGLFALLAAAGQWLASRDERFELIPTISLGLSVLLLAYWPSPSEKWFAIIGLSLAAIHAFPLLLQMWREPVREQRAIKLAGLALAAPALTGLHYYSMEGAMDTAIALVAAGFAVLPAMAIVSAWVVQCRSNDRRMAWLSGSVVALLFIACWFLLPVWMAPVALAGLTAGLLLFSEKAPDRKSAKLAFNTALLGLPLLFITSTLSFPEIYALTNGAAEQIDVRAVLRWGALAALFGLLAWRGQNEQMRQWASATSALLVYGVLAQCCVASLLPLLPPFGLLALAAVMRPDKVANLTGALAAMGALVAAWTLYPLAIWAQNAAPSLLGIPMVVNYSDLSIGIILKQLLVPAIAMGTMLWLLRDQLGNPIRILAMVVAAVWGGVAIHMLYRAGFAGVFGSDFVAFGLGQRLLWSAALVGSGVAVWKLGIGNMRQWLAPTIITLGACHTVYYSLLVHNPLWTEQAVGPLPVANLLVPLFAILPLALFALQKMIPELAARMSRPVHIVHMVMISGFAWATLRHGFHGSVLVVPGVSASEDIMRSILGIALGVSFLLWGIRIQRRDWRIASLLFMLVATLKVFLIDASGLEGLMRIGSFIALGFSLIGIGWLYSRQLRRDEQFRERTGNI